MYQQHRYFRGQLPYLDSYCHNRSGNTKQNRVWDLRAHGRSNGQENDDQDVVLLVVLIKMECPDGRTPILVSSARVGLSWHPLNQGVLFNTYTEVLFVARARLSRCAVSRCLPLTVHCSCNSQLLARLFGLGPSPRPGRSKISNKTETCMAHNPSPDSKRHTLVNHSAPTLFRFFLILVYRAVKTDKRMMVG